MKHFTPITRKSGHKHAAMWPPHYLQQMTKGQKRSELLLYAALWAILFVAPIASAFFTTHASSQKLADWTVVTSSWSLLAMFCTVFFVHNFFVAPLLVYANRKWAYALAVTLLAAVFVGYQLWMRPHPPKPMEAGPHPVEAEHFEHGMPQRPGNNTRQLPAPPAKPQDSPMEKPQDRPMGKPQDRPMGKPQGKADRPGRPGARVDEPPMAFGGQDSVAFIIMALLMALNVGAKHYFKTLDDKKRMKELERENLHRQLESLKYQINPHFFMNTLNNIHALVDIDAEQAKYTIEVLSKLMRYVLYEGNKTMAPLQKELNFITHYVELMRIRYTDKVSITTRLPQSIPDVQVPSLLFTTFVENAFKHGVSYRRPSFIEVSCSVDPETDEVVFACRNSRKPEDEERHGGVGLQNAKKRLQIIYGDSYTLHIVSNEEEYHVLLRLPTRQA